MDVPPPVTLLETLDCVHKPVYLVLHLLLLCTVYSLINSLLACSQVVSAHLGLLNEGIAVSILESVNVLRAWSTSNVGQLVP